MSTNQPRKPPGTPAGGQWAPSQHDEPDIDIPQITRSPGVPAGYGGYIVDSGYKGATKELDDRVQGAASALAERFGSDVEIRFNSDRRSGGAWLVTHPGDNGIDANTWIGINASLAPADEDEGGLPPRAYFSGAASSAWQAYLAKSDHQVQMGVYIKGEALRDPLSVDADMTGRRTFNQLVPDLDSALELIEEKSVAGDKAEIERRKSLEAEFGRRKAELVETCTRRWADRTKELPVEAPEREQIRKEELAVYEQGRTELVEQYWAEIQPPPATTKPGSFDAIDYEKSFKAQAEWLEGKTLDDARAALVARRATAEASSYNQGGDDATLGYIEKLERQARARSSQPDKES